MFVYICTCVFFFLHLHIRYLTTIQQQQLLLPLIPPVDQFISNFAAVVYATAAAAAGAGAGAGAAAAPHVTCNINKMRKLTTKSSRRKQRCS